MAIVYPKQIEQYFINIVFYDYNRNRAQCKFFDSEYTTFIRMSIFEYFCLFVFLSFDVVIL